MSEGKAGTCLKCHKVWAGTIVPFTVPVGPNLSVFAYCAKCAEKASEVELLEAIAQILSTWPKPKVLPEVSPLEFARQALETYAKDKEGNETPLETFLRIHKGWPKKEGKDLVSKEEYEKEAAASSSPSVRR